MKIKLHTVNVIETIDGTPQSLRAFTDNKKGNKRAENLFVRLVKEHNAFGQGSGAGPTFSKEEFSAMLDDGVYDDECGYQLFLTHST